MSLGIGLPVIAVGSQEGDPCVPNVEQTHRYLIPLGETVFADVADVTPQPHDFDQAAQWLLRHRRRANEGHLDRPLLKLARMFFGCMLYGFGIC